MTDTQTSHNYLKKDPRLKIPEFTTLDGIQKYYGSLYKFYKKPSINSYDTCNAEPLSKPIT